MSNIDIYKEYIQDSIINHLERLMVDDTDYPKRGIQTELIGKKIYQLKLAS